MPRNQRCQLLTLKDGGCERACPLSDVTTPIETRALVCYYRSELSETGAHTHTVRNEGPLLLADRNY